MAACYAPFQSCSPTASSLRYVSLALLLIAATASALNYPLSKAGILVLNDPQDLHAAPASATPLSGTARPAERAQQLDQHGEFVKIETEGGAIGWIQEDAFRLLLNAQRIPAL